MAGRLLEVGDRVGQAERGTRSAERETRGMGSAGDLTTDFPNRKRKKKERRRVGDGRSSGGTREGIRVEDGGRSSASNSLEDGVLGSSSGQKGTVGWLEEEKELKSKKAD